MNLISIFGRIMGLLLVFYVGNLNAQDPSFSQSYLSRVYLNPATTGSEQGTTIFLNYRSQWTRLPSSFNTVSFAVDVQSPRFSSGFGVHGYYDAAGPVSMKTNLVGLTYSYIVRISENFNIHLGVGASYVFKYLNTDLNFSSEYDAVNGLINSGDDGSVINKKVDFVDMDAGALFRFSFKIANRDIDNSIGFAVHHLTTPNESFQTEDSRVSRRYTAHFGTMIPVTENRFTKRSVFYISPVAKYEIQAGIDLFSVGVINTFKPVFVGVLYQDNGFADKDGTKALIFTGGVSSTLNKNINFTLGYSYDHNLTGISNVTGGVHELAMKFNFEKAELFSKNSTVKRKADCYQFKGSGSIRLF